MEKDVAFGQLGGLKIAFSGGKASVTISAQAQVLDGAVSVQGSGAAVVDSAVLIKMIVDEIQSHSPEGLRAIEEGVELMLINAVKAI